MGWDEIGQNGIKWDGIEQNIPLWGLTALTVKAFLLPPLPSLPPLSFHPPPPRTTTPGGSGPGGRGHVTSSRGEGRGGGAGRGGAAAAHCGQGPGGLRSAQRRQVPGPGPLGE